MVRIHNGFLQGEHDMFDILDDQDDFFDYVKGIERLIMPTE